MALVRLLARPLLAAPFIYEGVKTAQTPELPKKVYPELFDQADKALAESGLPDNIDTEMLLRIAGGISAGAGIAYALNKAPRLAAATLLCTTTVGWAQRKKVWELTGEERDREITALLKDLGLIGGMMLATVDHAGRPSLGYQVNAFVERSQKNAEKRKKELEKGAEKRKKDLEKKAKSTRKELENRGQDFRKDAQKALNKASKTADKKRNSMKRDAKKARRKAQKQFS